MERSSSKVNGVLTRQSNSIHSDTLGQLAAVSRFKGCSHDPVVFACSVSAYRDALVANKQPRQGLGLLLWLRVERPERPLTALSQSITKLTHPQVGEVDNG